MAESGCSFLNGQELAGSSRGSKKSTRRLPLHRRPIRAHVSNDSTGTGKNDTFTYLIAGLLIFVTLLVCLGLGLVWFTLFGTKCLPALTEDLADLA